MMHTSAVPRTNIDYDTLPILRPAQPAPPGPLRLDAAGATHRGLVRRQNEDQFLIADLHRAVTVHATSLPLAAEQSTATATQAMLLAVADGIGGHVGGRTASAVALDGLLQYAAWLMPWLSGSSGQRFVLDDLPRALDVCQHRVRAAAGAPDQPRPPGTTLTAALISWPSVYITHAGDSRCYLLRDGMLSQLTSDHTVAAELARRTGDAEATRWSHVLSNAISAGDEDVAAEVRRVDLAAGDAIVLCSDGLTRHVDDEMIARLVDTSPNASAAVTSLIERANTNGGRDNVTAVVARDHERSNVCFDQ